MIPIILKVFFQLIVALDHQRQTFACGSFEFKMLTQQILDSGASDVYRAAHVIQMIKSWAGVSQWSHRVSRLLKTQSDPPTTQICYTRLLEEHPVDSLSDNVYPLFVSLQKLFVIITFSKHIVEQMVTLIGWVMTPPWGEYMDTLQWINKSYINQEHLKLW